MSDKNWARDDIQFPRLIAEVEANGGFTAPLLAKLCESMDLEEGDVCELIDRAQAKWDRIKVRTVV